MWGFLAKAGAWAWAHKTEITAAYQLWRKLREKRKANQLAGESAKDYYLRNGKAIVVEAAAEAVLSPEDARKALGL